MHCKKARVDRQVRNPHTVNKVDKPKEALRSAHAIANNDPMFPRSLDLVSLDDRAIPTLHVSHDGLIHFECIVGCFFEESCVGDGANVGI